MSEDSGCALMIFTGALLGLALLWASVEVTDARKQEHRRAVCLERGGYYVEAGLTFRDSAIYCMERPIPVDITPGRTTNRENA